MKLIIIAALLIGCTNNANTIENKQLDKLEETENYLREINFLKIFVAGNELNYDNLVKINDSFVPALMELKNNDPEQFDQIATLILLKIHLQNIEEGNIRGVRINKESQEFPFLILLYSGFLNISKNYNIDSGINNVYIWAKQNRNMLKIEESVKCLDLLSSEIQKFETTVSDAVTNK